EKLSSSLEVLADRSHQRGPVAVALLREAREVATRLSPSALVPVVTTGHFIAGGVLAVAVMSLFLTFRMPPTDQTPGMLEESAAGLGVTMEEVTDMARLVASDASRTDSDVLE